jgi:hypothetical protein
VFGDGSGVAAVKGLAVTRVSPDETGPDVAFDHPVGCECDDLNNVVADAAPGESGCRN